MESEMAKKQQKSKQKLTAKQKEERIKAAEERAKREAEAKARKDRGKQIFTIVVCVILVLALGIPTVGLAVLGAS
jgi:uncharacterized ion transporter superfamily protein YfcC